MSAYNEETPAPADRLQASESSPLPSTETGRGELLDSILRETLAGDGAASNDSLVQALIDVRKRYPAEPFDAPHLREMVAAALQQRYGSRALGAMPEAVADSLRDDPVSHRRLESLWNLLSQAAGGLK